MKTYLDCFPCILRQALDAVRLSTSDEKTQKIVLNKIMALLIDLNSSLPAPQIDYYVSKKIKEITGCKDPYSGLKKQYNRIALDMYVELNQTIQNSPDPLFTAIRLAIAGNIIDFGANPDFDLHSTLKDSLTMDFAVNNYEAFCNSLRDSQTILYLGDNAGEIVFDKLLIETIKNKRKSKIYYAVKSEPIINDATIEDAKEVNMEKAAIVITNGTGAPGTILDMCSPAFLDIYKNAHMVISKGQGNYETLSEEKNKNIFFLLKVKCFLIARHLAVEEGSMVLKHGNLEWLH